MSDDPIAQTADTTDDLPKITRREKRFADFYLEGLSGSEAARRAGYKGERPDNVAYRFLKRPAVKRYLAEQRQSAEQTFGIRKERVLRRLNNIVEGTAKQLLDDKGNPIPVSKLDNDVAASIAGIEVERVEITRNKQTNVEGTVETETIVETRAIKVKQWDPVRASEQLSRMMGWNRDKLEIDNTNAPAPVINVEVYPDADKAEAEARASVSSKPATA